MRDRNTALLIYKYKKYLKLCTAILSMGIVREMNIIKYYAVKG
jgi:hypothetical protein